MIKDTNNIVYIEITEREHNTAGLKAPKDVSELCRRMGMKQFLMPLFPSDKPLLYQKIWLLLVCSFYWWKLEKTLDEGDVILYQHPMYGSRVAAYFIPRIKEKKGCKFIAVIHDLESLRKGIDGVLSNSETRNKISDNVILHYMDAIICHNEYMRQYLIGQGFDPAILVNLEIFDYLTDFVSSPRMKSDGPSIAIAGTLASGKCAYIYNICGPDRPENNDLTIHLYGNNYVEAMGNENMIYHGSFRPDELPSKLEGDFGLVWDGNSSETCKGNTGEYLKYNDPHKTSLYLVSGMPVIVWSQAAIADFVLENGVGIAVDSLFDLADIIKSITDHEYEQMQRNAMALGERIRNGEFFQTAMARCLSILNE